MLVANPVKGKVEPDKHYYPNHPLAVKRPTGKRKDIPLVTAGRRHRG